METNKDEQIVRSISAAYDHLKMAQPKIVGVPYWCDAGYLAGVAGIPAVVLGPGRVEEAHTAAEKVELSQVFRAADVYFESARRFCSS